MFLKLLLMLVPFLLLNNDAGGSGEGGGDGGEGGEGGGGQLGGEGDGKGEGESGGASGGGTQEPSANKLIKDFAKSRGISVEDLLGKYEQLENAGKSEAEKLTGERDRYKTENDRLTAEIRDLRSESAFVEAARAAQARAPKTLFRAYKDQLEFDKQGKPTNTAEVIAAVKKDEPDLFKPATGTTDAGRKGDGDGETVDVNAALRGLKR